MIHLIGLGGTGGYLLEPLVRLLTFHSLTKYINIICWEADTVEETNITRQIYYSDDIGRIKAINKIKQLKQLNNNIKLIPEYCNKTKLLKYLDIEDSIVIATVDNFASRKSFIEAIYESNNNHVFISPGNGLSNGQCYSFYYKNKQLTGFDCLLLPEWNKPKDEIPKVTNCIQESVSSPQLISANFMSALVVLNNMQCLLDKGYLYSECYFDVYENKLVSKDKIYIK